MRFTDTADAPDIFQPSHVLTLNAALVPEAPAGGVQRICPPAGGSGE